MVGPFIRLAQSVVYRVNPVLPQAYDDSLSYFEVLARLQKKVNELIEAVNELQEAVEEIDERLTIVETDVATIKTQITNILTRLTYLEEHPYVLPPATATTLGGVKIGEGVTVQPDGTISVSGGGGTPYVLPTMSASVKGGAILGDGLLITSDTLSVDVDNLDLSDNETITNIIDGTTEIDISENSTIETIEQNITNITDGTTPVPSSYVLPTMSASTKGGAKLGTGLTVTDDAVSVDVDNLDLSDNETITNIIDGTTEIDISEYSTIETIEQNITNITDGTTPVPSSYVLPTMSASTKGGAKLGTGLYVDNDILNVDNSEVDKLAYNLSSITGNETTGTAEVNYAYSIPQSGRPILDACCVMKSTSGTYYYVDVRHSDTSLNISVTFGKDSLGRFCVILQNLGNTFNCINVPIDIRFYDNNGETWFNRQLLFGNNTLSDIPQGATVCGIFDGVLVDKYNLIYGSTFNFTTTSKQTYGRLNTTYGQWYEQSYVSYNVICGQIANTFAYTVLGSAPKSQWLLLQENVANINSTLTTRVAVNVPQSTQESYPTVTEFNALLTALKNAGLMVADS